MGLIGDGRFWLGAIVGAVGYHFYWQRKSAKART